MPQYSHYAWRAGTGASPSPRAARRQPVVRRILRLGADTNRAAGSCSVLAPSVAAGVGAVQGGAALYSLAFAGSGIDPQDSGTDSLPAAVLANMVREVVALGESFYLLEVRRGRAFLLPMSGFTVTGASRIGRPGRTRVK